MQEGAIYSRPGILHAASSARYVPCSLRVRVIWAKALTGYYRASRLNFAMTVSLPGLFTDVSTFHPPAIGISAVME